MSVAAASPPTIEYFAPSPLRNHEATLRFAVNPNGHATTYEVEYGREAGNYFEHNYPWTREVPAGTTPVMGKADIPAHFQGMLGAGTEYHWRVIATNSAGTTVGPDQTFTTPDEPAPEFTTGAVTVLTPTLVRFEGTVDPGGWPLTGCRFRWVTESVYKHAPGFEGYAANEMVSFGDAVPCEESPAEIGSGTEPVAVHADVTLLKPGRYWFRLEGENAYEDSAGKGVELDTLPLLVVCGSGGCHSTSDPLTEAIPTPTPAAAPSVGALPHRMKKHGKKPLKKKRRQLRRNATIVAPR